MNTTYENFSDKEVVENVLTRYGLTQTELADILLISQSRVSETANGKRTLRPKVRRKLEQMLAEKDDRQE